MQLTYIKQSFLKINTLQTGLLHIRSKKKLWLLLYQ